MKSRIWAWINNLFRYGIVGGIAALAEWISFYVCNGPLGVGHMWATGIGFVAGTATNHLLCSRFVFQKTKYSKGGEIAFVYLVSLIGLLCNLGLMKLFVDRWHLWPMLSKVLATGIVFLWNFLSRRYLIYGERKRCEAPAAAGLVPGAVYHVAPADANCRDLSDVRAFVSEKLSWDVGRAAIAYESSRPPYHCYSIEYGSQRYLAMLCEAGGSGEPAEPACEGDLCYYDSSTGSRIIRLRAG